MEIYMCKYCGEIDYTKESMKQHYRNAHNARMANHKSPAKVCVGCGSIYLSRRYNSKHIYCCQKCYLETNNPRKDPGIIERIAEGNRGELNASKRPEVRKIISKKLKGRNAYWMKGKILSKETLKKRSEAQKKRWNSKESMMPILVRNINGKNIDSYSEGRKHNQIKSKIKRELVANNNCFAIEEYPIWLESKLYFIDVFVKDLDTLKEYYIEVGACRKEKRELLVKYFKGFINVTYRNWEVIKDEQEALGYWSGWYDRFAYSKEIGQRWRRSEGHRQLNSRNA